MEWVLVAGMGCGTVGFVLLLVPQLRCPAFAMRGVGLASAAGALWLSRRQGTSRTPRLEGAGVVLASIAAVLQFVGLVRCLAGVDLG
jgi:hypothetical protein